MSLGLKFFYGSYEHPAGEVRPLTFSKRMVQTPQGRRWSAEFTMTVEGQIGSGSLDSPLTTAQINSKIDQLETVYALDYKDAGFRLEDGTLTPHYMPTDSAFALSGTRVLQKSWVNQTPTEFANTRTFNITFWGQYLDTYSNLIEFFERVDYVGTGGIDWTLRPQWTGDPVYEQISAKTPILATQRGYTVGGTSRVAPPGPLFPGYEQEKYRRMSYSSPRDHGHNTLARYSNYRRDYSYRFMLLPTASTLMPNTRTF